MTDSQQIETVARTIYETGLSLDSASGPLWNDVRKATRNRYITIANEVIEAIKDQSDDH